MEATKKIWSKEEIKSLLEQYQNALENAVVTLFHLQTADEKQTSDTRHHNGVGFNGKDAYILSEYAKQLVKGKRLTEKQTELARKKMLKYSGQLAKIANGEIAVG